MGDRAELCVSTPTRMASPLGSGAAVPWQCNRAACAPAPVTVMMRTWESVRRRLASCAAETGEQPDLASGGPPFSPGENAPAAARFDRVVGAPAGARPFPSTHQFARSHSRPRHLLSSSSSFFTAKPFPAAGCSAGPHSPGRAARVQVGCVRWRCCGSDPRTLVGGDEEGDGRRAVAIERSRSIPVGVGAPLELSAALYRLHRSVLERSSSSSVHCLAEKRRALLQQAGHRLHETPSFCFAGLPEWFGPGRLVAVGSSQ
jgi:hypothetical protein